MYPLDFNSASLTALIDLMSDMTKPVHFRLFSCCEATASTAATATFTTSTHKNFCLVASEDGAFAVSTPGPIIGRVSRPPCSPAMTPFFGRGQMQFSISFYFALRLQRPHSGNG